MVFVLGVRWGRGVVFVLGVRWGGVRWGGVWWGGGVVFVLGVRWGGGVVFVLGVRWGGVRWGGGVVFVLVRRSRKVVPEELVTLMSWDPRDFLGYLVIYISLRV